MKDLGLVFNIKAEFEPHSLDLTSIGWDAASKLVTDQTAISARSFDNLGVSSAATAAQALFHFSQHTAAVAATMAEISKGMNEYAARMINDIHQRIMNRDMEANDEGRLALGATSLYCAKCEKVTLFDVFINNSSRPLNEHTIRAFCIGSRMIMNYVPTPGSGRQAEIVEMPVSRECGHEEKNELRLAAAASKLLPRWLRKLMRKATSKPIRPRMEDLRDSTPFDRSPEFRPQVWGKQR